MISQQKNCDAFGSFTMNIEQMADELIRQRAGRRRIAKVRKRISYTRLDAWTRCLTEAEVAEFKAAVIAAIERKNMLSRAPMGVSPLRTALQAGLSAGLLFSSERPNQTGLWFGDQQRVNAAAPAVEGQSAAGALDLE